MTAPSRPAPWIRTLALGAPLATVAVLAGLYAMGAFGDATPAACRSAGTAAARLKPLAHGEVAALAVAETPRPAPSLSFKDADGASRTLADFKGRTVLLNLWATWCVPCRKEMPALDRLQAALGGPDFQVVAVNIDTAKLDRPKQFLVEAGVTHLPLYTDSTAGAFQALRAEAGALGLPTTLLIDRAGCTLGTVAGPAEWDSPDVQALVRAAKQAG